MSPLALLGGLLAFALVFFHKPAADTPTDTATDSGTALDAISGKVSNMVSSLVSMFPTKYDDLIASAASDAGIDAALFWRLLYTESHFRDDIVTGAEPSKAGALGIAQFMPATAQELGIDPTDPEQSIPAAAKYLAKLIVLTGSTDAGVAAYNWGIGNVQRKGLVNAPPETVRYVAAITGSDITA